MGKQEELCQAKPRPFSKEYLELLQIGSWVKVSIGYDDAALTCGVNAVALLPWSTPGHEALVIGRSDGSTPIVQHDYLNLFTLEVKPKGNAAETVPIHLSLHKKPVCIHNYVHVQDVSQQSHRLLDNFLLDSYSKYVHTSGFPFVPTLCWSIK